MVEAGWGTCGVHARNASAWRTMSTGSTGARLTRPAIEESPVTDVPLAARRRYHEGVSLR